MWVYVSGTEVGGGEEGASRHPQLVEDHRTHQRGTPGQDKARRQNANRACSTDAAPPPTPEHIRHVAMVTGRGASRVSNTHVFKQRWQQQTITTWVGSFHMRIIIQLAF